jgi:thioredoxin-related protein
LAKPVVDGIEREIVNQARVVRIDVNSSQGRELAMHFGVRGVPTLLVFDGTGNVLLNQVGRINRSEDVVAITRSQLLP